MLFHPAESALAAAGKKIGLDAAGDVCFVSHAHSDHTSFIRAGHSLIASEATIDLMNAREKKKKNNLLDAASFREAKLSLHEAGHVLGAKQLGVEADGSKFVYTGDFNTGASLTCPPAEVLSADELFLDCTYGSGEWVFPPREEVYESIAKWAAIQQSHGFTVVLGAYSLGKAQELVAILNKYLQQAPVVAGKVERVCEVYRKHGVALDFIPSASGEASELYSRRAFTAVVPVQALSAELSDALTSHYRHPVRTAIATGWALHNNFYGVDAAFPLSDHADFSESLEFVQATGAKRVWCAHGFGQEFAAELRKLGIDGRPAEEEIGQKNLLEYGGELK